MRKSPKVTEVLPILYLRGLSTGDFAPALGEFFGSEAGLSASTVNRLTEAWQAEHAEWSRRDLSGLDYVYWWVDGIHFNIRLEEDRLCTLVIVGVRPDGTKELVALADGYRESTERWAEVLRSLSDRGLAAPVLAVGDGALGFWGALRDVFPATREQRCWVHVTANVSTRCPSASTPTPRKRSWPIYSAPIAHRRPRGGEALRRRVRAFDKATKKITGQLDVLLAFYDFPLEHWIHLRTTNPIESTFSTVRLRTKVTRGAGRARPAWPWPTSCSTPPRTAGAGSTATSSSRSCAPAPPSSTASYKRGANRRPTATAAPGPSPPDREFSSTTIDNDSSSTYCPIGASSSFEVFFLQDRACSDLTRGGGPAPSSHQEWVPPCGTLGIVAGAVWCELLGTLRRGRARN